MKNIFNSDKMYTYLKGFAMSRNWNNTISALYFARDMHRGQLRKSGEPYIVHPLTMANHAIALGVEEDAIVAAILLHDVCEDCGVTPSRLPVSTEVQEAVRLLTRVKGEPLEPYYRQIGENRVAAIAKLFDRCNNVSTMAGVFTLSKMEEYIQETNMYVLDLLRTSKNSWPNDSDLFFVLKYHISSLVDGLEACMQAASAEANRQSAREENEQQEVEDICPLCGGELNWAGDRDLQDDGAVASWSCPSCGAHGMAGWNLAFEGYFNIEKNA